MALWVGTVAAVAVGLAACAAPPRATLNGSGSTFAKAFYEEAIAFFPEGDVRVTYAGGGSGQGQQELADEVVTWAGTDATVEADDLSEFKGGTVLYFPTVAAPITVSYNLSGVDGIALSPATVADIFQARITTWDDPAIAADNPGAPLEDKPIKVVHRSDGSGTTANFTSYLESAAPNWTLGSGKEVRWPADTVGEKGNDGVAAGVKRDAGAIGYVDFSDAEAAGLQTAAIKNKDGNFVAPTLDAAEAALAAATVEPDLTFDPLDAPGPQAYPITAPTWVIVYQHQPDAETAGVLAAWLGFLTGDAQSRARDLGYARLPAGLARQAEAQIGRIDHG